MKSNASYGAKPFELATPVGQEAKDIALKKAEGQEDGVQIGDGEEEGDPVEVARAEIRRQTG